ncbi:hypothetical protein [Streptosporangium nondiastaticum]|nr:hypothetical protein [Streptosporangium nondiastaticum]
MRAVIGHVPHKITVHPATVTYGAACLGCTWRIKGKRSAEVVHDACVEHGLASRNGHVQFCTRAQGISYVLRQAPGTREWPRPPKIQVPLADSDRDGLGTTFRDPLATDAAVDEPTHEIVVHQQTVMYGADCLSCTWKAEREEAPERVQDACMAHTGRDMHELFRTVTEGLAYVLPKDRDAPKRTPDTQTSRGRRRRGSLRKRA